jgi:hypothetical protein
VTHACCSEHSGGRRGRQGRATKGRRASAHHVLLRCHPLHRAAVQLRALSHVAPVARAAAAAAAINHTRGAACRGRGSCGGAGCQLLEHACRVCRPPTHRSPFASRVLKYSTGTSFSMGHTLHLKRRPPSTQVQKGFMYVRQRLQRTMPWLPRGMTGTERPAASSAMGRTMTPSGSCHLRKEHRKARNRVSESQGAAQEWNRGCGLADTALLMLLTSSRGAHANAAWHADLSRSAVLLGTPMTVGRMLSALQLPWLKAGCGAHASVCCSPTGRASALLSTSGAPGPADSIRDSKASTRRCGSSIGSRAWRTVSDHTCLAGTATATLQLSPRHPPGPCTQALGTHRPLAAAGTAAAAAAAAGGRAARVLPQAGQVAPCQAAGWWGAAPRAGLRLGGCSGTRAHAQARMSCGNSRPGH